MYSTCWSEHIILWACLENLLQLILKSISIMGRSFCKELLHSTSDSEKISWSKHAITVDEESTYGLREEGKKKQACLNKAKEKVELTSGDLNLALNLATRSCVVTGVFCDKTALISSSLTGPEAVVEGPAFDDDGCGVLFGGGLLLEADPLTSLVDDFDSWFSKIMKNFNNSYGVNLFDSFNDQVLFVTKARKKWSSMTIRASWKSLIQ